MGDTRSESKDEADVRDLIESWTAAVRRRDLDAILQHHSSDIVMFDVPPPFQSRGIEAYAETWNTFFSWSNAPVAFDITAMDIIAGADVAFAVGTMRCAGPASDGRPEPLDFRLTVGLRKIGGQWTIVHEHHSIPAVD